MSMQPGYLHLFFQTTPITPELIAAQIDSDSHTPISDSSIEDFDKVMNVNAKGVLTCTRAVSKAMLAQDSRQATTRSGTRDIGRGSIVNLGSANSYAAIPGKVAYVASKHAMMGITKTAGELPPNSLCWLNVDTNSNQLWIAQHRASVSTRCARLGSGLRCLKRSVLRTPNCKRWSRL